MARARAAAAIEGVVLRFGLSPVQQKDRWRAWWLTYYDRTDPGKQNGTITACVEVLGERDLQLRVREGPAMVWSAKADSLHRALTDTLAQFGVVQIVPTS